MKTEFQTAKEMFFHYGGNKYLMARQEKIDEYEAYNISENTEKLWLNEIYEERILKMNINDFISISNVVDALIEKKRKYSDLIDFITNNYMNVESQEVLKRIMSFVEHRLLEDYDKNLRLFKGDQKETFLVLIDKLNKLKDMINR